MSIFKLEKLCYNYDGSSKKVLDNINFNFETGKSYAIVGRSGSGKTTLLSLMAGLDNPKSGRILYNDKDINSINKDKYRSRNVGVVFQSFNLLPHLTAVENVVLSMDIANVKIKNKKQHAIDLLNKVGIDEEKSKRRVLKLSRWRTTKSSYCKKYVI